MTRPAKPSEEYLKSAVLTATPEQLQMMLYDGAIRFAARGLEALQAADREAAFNAFDRAQQVVLELSHGIRREINPELAERMQGLYSFVYQRLIDATLTQNQQAAQDALRILRHQRETWGLLLEKVQREVHGRGAVQPTTPAGRTTDSPTTGEHRPSAGAKSVLNIEI
jgi:flagellar secretion chaperone FliS